MSAARNLPDYQDVFLFYDTKASIHWGRLTLVGFSRRDLFKSHSNHFKGWKEKFMRTRGRVTSSSDTTRVDGAHRNPLALKNSPMAITS